MLENDPFRKEEDPSFHTSFLGGKWIWNDFGDTGGTVIDFVMRHENFSRVREALEFLEQLSPHCMQRARGEVREDQKQDAVAKLNGETYAQVRQQKDTSYPGPQLQFLNAHDIQNPIIFSYLEQERCIPRDLAYKYLKEIHYRHNTSGRKFYALGMQNCSQGYEIRMASDEYAFAKSSLGKKDISFIPGLQPGKGKINVFEGMLDFLSLMAMYDCKALNGDSIILNTTRYVDRAINFIRSKVYLGMNCFLDNDRAGEEGLLDFHQAFGEDFVFAQNELYAGSKDLNEGWVSG